MLAPGLVGSVPVRSAPVPAIPMHTVPMQAAPLQAPVPILAPLPARPVSNPAPAPLQQVYTVTPALLIHRPGGPNPNTNTAGYTGTISLPSRISWALRV